MLGMVDCPVQSAGDMMLLLWMRIIRFQTCTLTPCSLGREQDNLKVSYDISMGRRSEKNLESWTTRSAVTCLGGLFLLLCTNFNFFLRLKMRFAQ